MRKGVNVWSRISSDARGFRHKSADTAPWSYSIPPLPPVRLHGVELSYKIKHTDSFIVTLLRRHDNRVDFV